MYKLKGKFIISGEIKILTGLHIGTSGDFSAIGAVDNIVIRDSITNKPIIPGSTLKGKMRYLLARTKYNTAIKLEEIEKENEEIARLFGASKPNVILSRLQFQDMLLTDKSAEELNSNELDLSYTEIKYENTINRITCVANPRQQERVPAGARFDFKLIYNVEEENDVNNDMENILLAIEVLEDDYLGGHGTRGYGLIKFENLKLEKRVYIEENKEIMENLEKNMKNVKRYNERFEK